VHIVIPVLIYNKKHTHYSSSSLGNSSVSICQKLESGWNFKYSGWSIIDVMWHKMSNYSYKFAQMSVYHYNMIVFKLLICCFLTSTY
jgi:hypothetical protein